MRHAALLATLALCAGCATVAPRPGVDANIDPWESWNRKVFAFNEALDRQVLIPVATTYNDVLPSFARRGIANVFANFGDAWSAVNSLLQGKLTQGAEDTMRFATNTFLGFGGLLDIATEAGIPRHGEDLGQTLATWGVGAGPYMVLPLFGPSTVRDTVALPGDLYVSPALLVDEFPQQLGIGALHVVSTRAQLLGANRLIEDIALDKYSFIRDAWLQRRRSLILGEAADREDDENYDDDGDGEAAPAPASPAPR